MFKIFRMLFIFISLGFFLFPSMNYACGLNKTESIKKCCKSDSKTNKQTEQEECSKNSESKTDNHNKCSANCTACICHIHCINPLLTFNKNETINNIFSILIEKKIFFCSTNYNSLNLSSIWNPPKYI